MAISIITSEGEGNESFVSTINELVETDRQNSSNPTWTQFLLDHYRYILKHSTTVSITQATMQRYRYRLRDYLKDNHEGHVDIEKAVRVINRIPHDKDFDYNVTKIYIPNPQTLADLYRAYMTQQARIRSIA